MKQALVRAALAGIEAILAVDARSRFIHCDPLVHVVAPSDAPHLRGEAEHFNNHVVHEAWDMIAASRVETGRKAALS